MYHKRAASFKVLCEGKNPLFVSIKPNMKPKVMFDLRKVSFYSPVITDPCYQAGAVGIHLDSQLIRTIVHVEYPCPKLAQRLYFLSPNGVGVEIMLTSNIFVLESIN